MEYNIVFITIMTTAGLAVTRLCSVHGVSGGQFNVFRNLKMHKLVEKPK